MEEQGHKQKHFRKRVIAVNMVIPEKIIHRFLEGKERGIRQLVTYSLKLFQRSSSSHTYSIPHIRHLYAFTRNSSQLLLVLPKRPIPRFSYRVPWYAKNPCIF